MLDINERLKEPLKLFLKELDAHLENLAKREDLSTAELLEQTRKRLESRFHLIKGSAGFFSLKTLMSLAAHGEEVMKKAKTDASLIQPFLQNELPAMLKELGEELKALKARFL